MLKLSTRPTYPSYFIPSLVRDALGKIERGVGSLVGLRTVE